MVKRNTKIAHATKKGHVPPSKPEGKQAHPKAFATKHNAAPGLYSNTGGRAVKKAPTKAAKVVHKDRKGVAHSSKAKG